MHVLIIGGTRFVGYQLTWRLLAGGHRVTLLNRGSAPDPFGDRVERIICDRTSPDFQRLMHRRTFDAAVDFAAYGGDDARQAVATFDSDRVGHYIAISTGQVYLVRTNCPWPAPESHYDGPVMDRPTAAYDLDEWLYGVHKREMEDVLAAAWETHRFPGTRLRLPMVSGERDHFRRVESYLWRILDGGPVLLPDGGLQPTRHVYSGAVVRAICGMLGQPATFGQAYNLCQEEQPTLAELITLLAQLLGAPARLAPVSTADLATAGLRPMDVSPFSDTWASRLDPSRAKAELGFHHEPLAQYLDKIVTHFLNAPPATPPANYAHRSRELELTARLRTQG